jgi:hypothetical protein
MLPKVGLFIFFMDTCAKTGEFVLSPATGKPTFHWRFGWNVRASTPSHEPPEERFPSFTRRTTPPRHSPKLSLRELETLSCARSTGLLAFLDAAITGKESILPQSRP